MARFAFTVSIAPPEVVFDLWTDLDRTPSPTEVLEAERPRRVRTRFGNP